MDYEQKYKEALDKAKKLYGEGTITESLSYVFPELKESEDEEMRKALINGLNDCMEADYLGWSDFGGMPIEDLLAWLEKQGEQKKSYDVCDSSMMDNKKSPYGEKRDFGYFEEKSADKVEPKIKVKYAGCEYNVLEVKDIAGVTYYGIEDEPNHIDYVKADNCKIISGGYGIKENGSPYPTKTAVFSEQKPAWSEEDENMLDTIIDASEHHCMLDLNDIDWLKSLKYKVQPKQEWSEEDELKRTTLIDVVKKQRGSAIFEGLLPEELTDWLESLRPQNKWKPTEEQLYWLKQVIPNNSTSVSNEIEVLSELYRQLKALKEL